ncbi:hypothetical protein [Bifidobacterium eulemuris]|uniref:Repeat-containing protein n=1 Tax=Bifidobacterium eulemuris TaxID=1765219 RepID=A0A261GFB5_9BIFI|nr:hypothetical protein [Bifidobacterium eulemuris]OZG69536.1 repeat-containing protein [Bifidobacterium eulemuris]QOL32082.1 hypothetical protein BE0216_06105 [Bifidobacterium eulemuris]
MMDARWLEAVGRATCAVARRALPSLCALAMLAGVATSATNAYAEEASGTDTAQTTTDTTGTAGTDTSDTTGTTTDSTGTAGSSEDTSGTAGGSTDTSDSTGATGDSSADSTGSSADSSDASDATGAGDADVQGDSAGDASGTSDVADASDEPSVVSDDSSGDNTGVSADEGVFAANDDGTDAQAVNSTTWDPKNAKAYTDYTVGDLKTNVPKVGLTLNGQATTASSNNRYDNYALGFVKVDPTNKASVDAEIYTTYNCGAHMTLAKDEDELITILKTHFPNEGITDGTSAFAFLVSKCFRSEYIQRVDGKPAVLGSSNYYLSSIGLPNGQGYKYDGVWLKYQGQLRMRLAWMGTINNETYVLAYDESGGKTATNQCTPWVDGNLESGTGSKVNKCMLTKLPDGAQVVVSFVNTGSIRVGYRSLGVDSSGTGLSGTVVTEATGDASTHETGWISFQVQKTYAGSQLMMYLKEGYTADENEKCSESTNSKVYDSLNSASADTRRVTVAAVGELNPSTNMQSFTLKATSGTLGSTFQEPASGSSSSRGFLLCVKESISASVNGSSTIAGTTVRTTGSSHNVSVTSISGRTTEYENNTGGMSPAGQQTIGMVTTVRNQSLNPGFETMKVQINKALGGQYTGGTDDGSELRGKIKSAAQTGVFTSIFGTSAMYGMLSNSWDTKTQNGLGANDEVYTDAQYTDLSVDGLSVYNGGSVAILALNDIRYQQDNMTSQSDKTLGWTQFLSAITICATSTDTAANKKGCAYEKTLERASVPTYMGKTGDLQGGNAEPTDATSMPCAYTTLSGGALNGVKVAVCEGIQLYRPSGSMVTSTTDSNLSNAQQNMMSIHPYFIFLEGVTTDVSVKLTWTKSINRELFIGNTTGVSDLQMYRAYYGKFNENGVEVEGWEHSGTIKSGNYETKMTWASNPRQEWAAWTTQLEALKPGDEVQQIKYGSDRYYKHNDYRAGRGMLFRFKRELGYTNYQVKVTKYDGKTTIDLPIDPTPQEHVAVGTGNIGFQSTFWSPGSAHSNRCFFEKTEGNGSPSQWIYCLVYDKTPKYSTQPYTLSISATAVTYQATFHVGDSTVQAGTKEGQVDQNSMPVDVSYNLAGRDPSTAQVEVQNVVPTRTASNGKTWYFEGWKAYWCTDEKCAAKGDEITTVVGDNTVPLPNVQPGNLITIGLFAIPDDAKGVYLEAQWSQNDTVRTVESVFGKTYQYYVGTVVTGVPYDGWSAFNQNDFKKDGIPAFQTSTVRFIMPVPEKYSNNMLATTYRYDQDPDYMPPATLTAKARVKPESGTTDDYVNLSLVSGQTCDQLLRDKGVTIPSQRDLYCTTGDVALSGGLKVQGLGNDIANTSWKYTPNPTSESGPTATNPGLSGTLMVAVYRVEQKVSYADNISMLHDSSFKPSLCWLLMDGMPCYPMGDGSAERPSIASMLANYPAYTGRYLFDRYYLPTVNLGEKQSDFQGKQGPLNWKVENNNSRTVTFNGWSVDEGKNVVDPAAQTTTQRITDYNTAVTWKGQWTASLPPVSQLPLTGTKPWWMQVIVPAVLVALLGLAAWLRWRKGSQLWSNHA